MGSKQGENGERIEREEEEGTIGDALLCLGRYRPKGSPAHGEST